LGKYKNKSYEGWLGLITLLLKMAAIVPTRLDFLRLSRVEVN
jgi:hypothetical protein